MNGCEVCEMFTRQCANKSSYVNRRFFFSSFYRRSCFLSLSRSLPCWVCSIDRSFVRLLVALSLYKWRLFVIHLLILNHLTLIFVLHTLKMNYLNNRFLSLFRHGICFHFHHFPRFRLFIYMYTHMCVCVFLHVSRLIFSIYNAVGFMFSVI